jgi:hypothetical protein
VLTNIFCVFQFQVHCRDWTSFYEQVPKEILPTDYGVEPGSVAEHWGMTDHDFSFKIKKLETIMLTGTSCPNNSYKVK